MRFPWYKTAWRLMWLPPAYFFRIVFCLTVGLMHFSTDVVEEAWRDTA